MKRRLTPSKPGVRGLVGDGEREAHLLAVFDVAAFGRA